MNPTMPPTMEGLVQFLEGWGKGDKSNPHLMENGSWTLIFLKTIYKAEDVFFRDSDGHFSIDWLVDDEEMELPDLAEFHRKELRNYGMTAAEALHLARNG